MAKDNYCRFRLLRADVAQILEALELRAAIWENTARYANGEFVEDMIEEHSSAEEAEAIANHYRHLINQIREQLPV